MWNGLIDRRPAVIARCAGTADVVEAVQVARTHRPVVSIRGGGHQVAGSAVCDDGLVIDLSAMKGVHVDPAARTVRAQAGATWRDVDRATQLFGLATPGGEVSETGVAGLTSAVAWACLMRAHGLSCDNLRSLEIVTADGAVRTASREEHPDLFWAARGGGRGLGVVTSFEFDLHPLGPRVATAQVLYPYADAASGASCLRRDSSRGCRTASPLSWCCGASPPTRRSGGVARVQGRHRRRRARRPPGEGAAVLAPLAEARHPSYGHERDGGLHRRADRVRRGLPLRWPVLLQVALLGDLTDPAIDVLLDCDAHRPTPDSLIVIRTLGGAVARVGRGRERLPAPQTGTAQRELRRRLVRLTGAGRHGDRMVALDVGRDGAVRHWRGVPQLRRTGPRGRPPSGVRVRRGPARPRPVGCMTPPVSSPMPGAGHDFFILSISRPTTCSGGCCPSTSRSGFRGSCSGFRSRNCS